MKPKIRFKIHLSANKVLFLGVTVSLKHKKLRAKLLFTKPTDSHFYLNTQPCRLFHVLENLPNYKATCRNG